MEALNHATELHIFTISVLQSKVTPYKLLPGYPSHSSEFSFLDFVGCVKFGKKAPGSKFESHVHLAVYCRNWNCLF